MTKPEVALAGTTCHAHGSRDGTKARLAISSGCKIEASTRKKVISRAWAPMASTGVESGGQTGAFRDVFGSLKLARAEALIRV